MDGLGNISRPALKEQIQQNLISYIQTRNLGPGERLPTEEMLCGSLGVSRTALREALETLKDRGLVKSVQGLGTFVDSPSADAIANSLSTLLMLEGCTILDVLELRRAIEVHLVAQASQNASERDLLAIEKAYVRLRDCGEDLETCLLADSGFHKGIARASGNRLGAILVDAMMILTTDLRMRSFASDLDPRKMHEEINEHLQARNGELAKTAMASHFDASVKLL